MSIGTSNTEGVDANSSFAVLGPGCWLDGNLQVLLNEGD